MRLYLAIWFGVEGRCVVNKEVDESVHHKFHYCKLWELNSILVVGLSFGGCSRLWASLRCLHLKLRNV